LDHAPSASHNTMHMNHLVHIGEFAVRLSNGAGVSSGATWEL